MSSSAAPGSPARTRARSSANGAAASMANTGRKCQSWDCMIHAPARPASGDRLPAGGRFREDGRMAPHPDRLALLRAIAAAPDDDTPRLVYADWLDERGTTDADRARAE